MQRQSIRHRSAKDRNRSAFAYESRVSRMCVMLLGFMITAVALGGIFLSLLKAQVDPGVVINAKLDERIQQPFKLRVSRIDSTTLSPVAQARTLPPSTQASTFASSTIQDAGPLDSTSALFELVKSSFALHVSQLPLGKKVIIAGLSDTGSRILWQLTRLWLEAAGKPSFYHGDMASSRFDPGKFAKVGTAAALASSVVPWLKRLSAVKGTTVLLSHCAPEKQMSSDASRGIGRIRKACHEMQDQQKCEYGHFDHVDYDMSLDDVQDGGPTQLAEAIGRIAHALGIQYTEAAAAEVQRRYTEAYGRAQLQPVQVNSKLQAQIKEHVASHCPTWQQGNGSIQSNIAMPDMNRCFVM